MSVEGEASEAEFVRRLREAGFEIVGTKIEAPADFEWLNDPQGLGAIIDDLVAFWRYEYIGRKAKPQ